MMFLRNRVAGRLLNHLLGQKYQQFGSAGFIGVRGTRYCSTQVTTASEVNGADVKSYSEIPGPRTFPLIKSAWMLIPLLGGVSINKIHILLQRLYETYGKIVRLEIPAQPNIVWIFDPDDIENLYRNEGVWPIRMVFTSVELHRKKYRKDIFRENAGLLVEQEKAWHTHRSKLQQLLMRPSSAVFYFSALQNVTDEFLQRIRSIRQPETEELLGCILPELYRWTLEAVGIVALDTKLGCISSTHNPGSEAHKLIEGVTNILESLVKLEMGIKFWKYFPTPAWKKMTKYDDLFSSTVIKYTNAALERLKDRPKDNEEEPSLLERILLKDPDLSTARLMALDMIEGAIDTTSTCVAFTMYQLAKNPEKQEKLHQEIMSLLPSKDSSLTPEIIGKLRYMKACIKETLRLTPIFMWINRVAPEDIIIGGYRIPKGTMINMGWHTLMRQEKNFPEALKFKPERWLRDAEKKKHAFSFLPFSYGPRMCIGRRFAELEMWLLVTKMIQNFKVEYHYGDMEISTKFINRPEKPLKFKLIER